MRIEASTGEPLVAMADVVFGCLDRDLPRLNVTELCVRCAKPYVGLLDQQEMTRDRMSPEHRAADERIYGVEWRPASG